MTMMISKNKSQSPFQRIVHDRGGNFAIVTALLAPVLLAVAGLALDADQMTQYRANVQDAGDSAALAAAAALSAEKPVSKKEAEILAINFFKGQMAQHRQGTTGTPVVTINEVYRKGAAINYSVSVRADYTLPLTGFSRLMGHESARVATISTAESSPATKGVGASMYLVLDISGSMGWRTDGIKSYRSCVNIDETNWLMNPIPKTYPCNYTKMEALKTATSSLFSQLNAKDPKREFIRTGAVAYNSVAINARKMDWGTAATQGYVNGLKAEGGTDASGALKLASTALRKSKDGEPVDNETEQQAAKGNTVVNRYIVLMTDGEMTGRTGSWQRTLDENSRNACDEAKKDGIEIFSVAFMAPWRGQDLLKYCASSPADYYEADNMESLVNAFKNIGQKAAQQFNRLTN